MTEIPVTFEYKGKEVKGSLTSVMGAGSSATYELTVEGFHWGKLWYVTGHPGFQGGHHAVAPGWRFTSNQHPDLEDQAEFFGYVVIAWLDSHY